MAVKSKIEWTDATWNPIRGCSVVSGGCRNCYAMSVAARFSGKSQAYEGLAYRNESGAHWTGQVQLIEEHLEDPLRWKRPRRIFVNSMNDLFHESVPDEWIDKIFAVMALAPQHTFQILTKRPERMRDYFSNMEDRMDSIGQQSYDNFGTMLSGDAIGEDFVQFNLPLDNVWLGVSVEDQATFDERWPYLRDTHAWTRWLSVEPLLGPINALSALKENHYYCDVSDNPDDPTPAHRCRPVAGWLVVGGESGPNARPIHPDWARSLRDQCVAADVPFFFKQWGAYQPLGSVFNTSDKMNRSALSAVVEANSIAVGLGGQTYWQESDDPVPAAESDAYVMARVGKKAAGRLLDGREWNEYPEMVREVA